MWLRLLLSLRLSFLLLSCLSSEVGLMWFILVMMFR